MESLTGLPLGLLVSITFLPGVPFQLPTDSRFMHTNYLCCIGLIESHFQKMIYEVSLFLGNLQVTHREACLWLSAPSTLVSGKSLILLQLTFLLPTLLHLRVESKDDKPGTTTIYILAFPRFFYSGRKG